MSKKVSRKEAFEMIASGMSIDEMVEATGYRKQTIYQLRHEYKNHKNNIDKAVKETDKELRKSMKAARESIAVKESPVLKEVIKGVKVEDKELKTENEVLNARLSNVYKELEELKQKHSKDVQYYVDSNKTLREKNESLAKKVEELEMADRGVETQLQEQKNTIEKLMKENEILRNRMYELRQEAGEEIDLLDQKLIEETNKHEALLNYIQNIKLGA